MYQEFITFFGQQHVIQGLFLSVVFVIAILTISFTLRRFVKGKKEILDKDQRRWMNRINNTTSIALLIALIFIWAPQLQTFALSITALAVAIVITTKELLMCLTGGFLRAATKPFTIGDWITVEDKTGEVMRVNALVTVVEEIDMAGKGYQFTGRTIQIPNSKFLSQNVESANFLRSYIYHEVSIPLKNPDLDPQALMGELKRITETYYAPFRNDATKFNKKVEKKAAVDFDDPDPQFFLRIKEESHQIFMMRMFVPTKAAAKIGTNITEDFMKFVYDLRQEEQQKLIERENVSEKAKTTKK